tara:strand:- start:43 stop:2049 length:2007 start_codon:yes stop_codon:yes gene_type:complete
MAQTFEDLKKEENKQQIFNQIKSDGYRLLQQGEIDSKTYYAKTRQAGIELGLIDPKDYPGRLPGFAEPFLEILGGTAGAVGGFFVGGPFGAAAGAGLGAGSGSLAADFLGDLLAPDMPAPSAEERLQDAATTAVVDTALTAAVPVAGKALKPAVTKIVDRFTSAKEALKKQAPDAQTQIGFLERSLGLTDEAAQQAKELAKEGVPLSLGQASSSPFVRGIYNLSSRMPIAGAPGQKQLLETFQRVDNALNARIAPTAKLKPLTETERSKLIQEFGLESFNKWRNTYKSVYKRAEQLNQAKGDYFDLRNLALTSRAAIPRSELADIPQDLLNFVGDIEKNVAKKINFNDVKLIDERLSSLSKKYDPARGEIPNNTAFRAITKIQDQLKREIRNPQDEAGRLMSAGDRLFKEYMAVVEGKTGKEFQKALGRGALRPGIGRPPSQRLEDLYAKTFGDVKSPEAVKDLKNLIGTDRVNILAANYLDDVFTKYLKGDKKEFSKLYNELGFNNLRGKKFEATKELLKDYKSAIRNVETGKLEIKSVSADDLYKFMDILKDFPEALPDVNTFVARSGLLRASQALGPSAIIGTTGIQAGGGAGALAGFGLLRLLNSFLARPFNKNLLNEAMKGGKQKKEEFMRKFLASLPELPDVPVSAIAVQPAVPLVSEQIQK